MAISTFKGVVPVEDWSQFNNKIDQSVNRNAELRRQKEYEDKQDRKESEAKYLQQARVDPVYSASSYWQKEQGKQIENFQKYLGQVYYKSQNKPSIQDQIDIQNHKQALLGWQQNLAADQRKYEMAVNEIKKDPYGKKYDLEHFKEKINSWVDPNGDGKLGDDLLLPPLINDLKSHNISKKYSGKMQKNETINGKVKTTVESLPEDQKKAHVIEDMYKDPSEYRSAIEGFSKLPSAEKQQWMSKYQDKDSEKAITDWYYDTYGKYAYPDIVNKGIAPKGRVGGSGNSFQQFINYDNPSDVITLKKPYGEQKIDTWGKVDLPYTPKAGSVPSTDYIDMKDGLKKPWIAGKEIPLNNPYILYLPNIKSYGLSEANDYRNETGKLKGGHNISPFVITTKPDGKEIAIRLTPAIKNTLKSKFPKLGEEIDKLPDEIVPKSNEEPGSIETKKTVTKKDPLGLF